MKQVILVSERGEERSFIFLRESIEGANQTENVVAVAVALNTVNAQQHITIGKVDCLVFNTAFLMPSAKEIKGQHPELRVVVFTADAMGAEAQDEGVIIMGKTFVSAEDIQRIVLG